MTQPLWDTIGLPPEEESQVWELFHENSKAGRYNIPLSNDVVSDRMKKMYEALPFDSYPAVDLPNSFTPLQLTLHEAIVTRVTDRSMAPCLLTLENMATILYYAYGVTRDNKDTEYTRSFRTTPSGGALYPLEIFFHSTHIKELQSGIYHYNPIHNNLRFLQQEDKTSEISEVLNQKNIAFDTSVLFFITALFERSTFKYKDRGYRFALLEAGHVAQNINLVANAIGLGSINICGYFDREVDKLLGLDGLMHSTVYMIGIGKKLDVSQIDSNRVE